MNLLNVAETAGLTVFNTTAIGEIVTIFEGAVSLRADIKKPAGPEGGGFISLRMAAED
jgi:hypothetical protein